MKSKDIQSKLDELWGAIILDVQTDLLHDNIKFKMKIIDNKVEEYYDLHFIDVSSYYYVKDSDINRFKFYDREKVEYLELTSIQYQSEFSSDLKMNLQNEEEWSSEYGSNANILIEIWDSILAIEARGFSLNGNLINLKG